MTGGHIYTNTRYIYLMILSKDICIVVYLQSVRHFSVTLHQSSFSQRSLFPLYLFIVRGTHATFMILNYHNINYNIIPECNLSLIKLVILKAFGYRHNPISRIDPYVRAF